MRMYDVIREEKKVEKNGAVTKKQRRKKDKITALLV